MKALGYARVSTDGQATDGVSLDAQQARTKAWCEANGYVLLGVQVDAGLSGCRADNRPALQAALVGNS
jgi:DNA invertase Pin-like site-specific DNA recombinase